MIASDLSLGDRRCRGGLWIGKRHRGGVLFESNPTASPWGRGRHARSGIIGLSEGLVKGGIDAVSGLEFGCLVVMVVFVLGRKQRFLDALGEGKESDEDQRDRAESWNPRTKGQTEASDAQAQRKQRGDGSSPKSVHHKRATERITRRCGTEDEGVQPTTGEGGGQQTQPQSAPMVGLFAKCFVGTKDGALKDRRKACLEREIAALLGEHQKAPEDQQKAHKVHCDVLDSCKGSEAVHACTKESSERAEGSVRQEPSEVIGGVCARAAVFSVALIACVERHESPAHADTMKATDKARDKNTGEKGPHKSPSFRGQENVLYDIRVFRDEM